MTTENKVTTTDISNAMRRFLAKPRAAFFVWPRSFHELGREQLNLLKMRNTLIQSHFLPESFCIDTLNYRELLEIKDQLIGLTEVWWRIVRKRLRQPLEKENTQSLDSVLSEFGWEEWLPKSARISITAEAQKSSIRSAKYLRESLGGFLQKKGFEVTDTGSNISIKVSLFRDTLSIYLPLTFEPHWQRSYKTSLFHPAALREDLGQSLIQCWLNWSASGKSLHTILNLKTLQSVQTVNSEHKKGQKVTRFFLPFSGSGTFYFELVTLIWKLGHSQVGNHKIFEQSLAAPNRALANLRKKAKENSEQLAQALPLEFICQETHNEYLSKFKENDTAFRNLMPEGTKQHLSLTTSESDFFCAQADDFLTNTPGICFSESQSRETPIGIFLNPPFGMRIESSSENNSRSEEAPAYFERIAKRISTLMKGHTLSGGILCPDHDSAERFIKGLKWAPLANDTHQLNFKVIQLSYGTLDARFVLFENTFTDLQSDASYSDPAIEFADQSETLLNSN